MVEHVRFPGPVTRFYQWLAGYFRAVINPTLSMRARIISGAKGLAAIGALGLALVMRVCHHFDPVYAKHFQSTQSQNRPAQRADLVGWQTPRYF